MRGDYEGALETAKTYQEIFGKERFFIELQDHGIQEEKAVVQPLVRIAQEIGAGLVVTNDSHYTVKEEALAHDILLCLQTDKKLADENRMKFFGEEFYLKSEEEMRQLFPNMPQAYDNTAKIADMCNFDYELGNVKLPVYEYPPQYANSFEYFKQLCYDGAKKRYGEELPQKVTDQIEYELGVIHKMGYTDYYLIVWDFINYAKEHGIPVGPGRGSGAGSICAYVIGITNIDPLKYELFFERFLNPERVSMPDFDIDFCYNRVGEVEEYVVKKYGKERVSHVITFQTMAAKGSIKDVGRVMGYSYSDCDKISKMIPKDAKTIDDALKMNAELKELYDSDERTKILIDNAKSIEGMPKASSQHAAGVLICDKPIVEYAPMMTSDGQQVIQARKEEVEELGLLKFDFLKLRTLTVVDDTLKAIKKNYGIDIDIDKIDMEDQKVFANLSTGKMYGVFQFESAGMKDTIGKLHPTSIEDLTAVISLYRPGPMDSIPRYIRNRFHPEEVTYYHPCVEDILKPTYGCLVYQGATCC
jgi:DNA polymerase-3 subunit alpha